MSQRVRRHDLPNDRLAIETDSSSDAPTRKRQLFGELDYLAVTALCDTAATVITHGKPHLQLNQPVLGG